MHVIDLKRAFNLILGDINAFLQAKGMNYCTSLYMYENFSLSDVMLTVLFTTTNIAQL